MYSSMLLQSHRRVLMISTHGLVVCKSVRDECVWFFFFFTKRISLGHTSVTLWSIEDASRPRTQAPTERW